MNKRESEAFAEKESNYGKVFKVAGPRKHLPFFPLLILFLLSCCR